MRVNLILYVKDQQASCLFYQKVLGVCPVLNVPGMSEFHLNNETVLGLMPVAGIKRLLGDKLPDPERAVGVPRAEVYLTVDDPATFHQRALENGAIELSPLEARGWGDDAAYSMDTDGHVIVFAKKTQSDRQA